MNKPYMVFCSDSYLRWLWFRKIVKTVVSDPEGDAPPGQMCGGRLNRN